MSRQMGVDPTRNRAGCQKVFLPWSDCERIFIGRFIP